MMKSYIDDYKGLGQNGIWVNAEGETLYIEEMDSEHLKRVYILLWKHLKVGPNKEAIIENPEDRLIVSKINEVDKEIIKRGDWG